MDFKYYSEGIIFDGTYKNRRGEAEKIAQEKWAKVNLDAWFANRQVPFHKPLYEIAHRFNDLDWNGINEQLLTEQEKYSTFTSYKKCPICGNSIITRKFNFTEIHGCYSYINGTCSYGMTYYHQETLHRIEIINQCLDDKIKNIFIKELRENGAKGLPDIIGHKNNVLHFIEVKDFIERLSQEQIYWLDWLGKHEFGKSIVLRVKKT